MKRLLTILFISMFSLLSCGGSENKNEYKNVNYDNTQNANIITAEYKTDGSLKINTVASSGKKVLVIYFSRSGNTKYAAEYIRNLIDADIFEITTVKPYPEEYRATTDQAKKELNDNFLPELRDGKKDLSQYDVIILGYPIWWGTIPQAVKKFIMDNDFSGKTIAPFCTHGGSGSSRSVDDIKKVAKNALVTDVLSIKGASVRSSVNEINAWVDKINVLNK